MSRYARTDALAEALACALETHVQKRVAVGDLAWDTYATPALPTDAEIRERERIVTARVNALARLRAIQRQRGRK